MADSTKGFFVVTVIEATAKNKDEESVWDSKDFEAFVRVELRGGSKRVKKQTAMRSNEGDTIVWKENLILELFEDADELRLMICRHKEQNGKSGVSVMAACGIFVKDIMDAVPIDKYFQLYKPSLGGEGGFIRIGLNFVNDLSEATAGASGPVAARPASANPVPQHLVRQVTGAQRDGEAAGGGKGKGPLKRLFASVRLPLLLAAGTVVYWAVKRRQGAD